jgi:hypothetical protein
MMDHSQAKVVVIFGAASAKRFLKRFPQSILICALGTNMSAGRVLIRPQTMRLPSQIVITCSHPENLVGAGSRLTYRQNCLLDYVINLACALASVDSEIDTTCFSDAAAGLYQPAGGHRHSLELAISVVKSEIAAGEDLLPEHVPSTLVHELETVSASWQLNISMAFDRLICKITGRENSLEIQ